MDRLADSIQRLTDILNDNMGAKVAKLQILIRGSPGRTSPL